MPTSTAAAESLPIEDQLAELLSELSHVQTELLDVLSQKRDRIAASDLPGVADLQPKTEDLCDRLRECHERRARLLTSIDGSRHDTLGDLIASLPSGQAGILPKQVKETSARVRLLQHQSLTNWVLAQRSILHLSQLLEIIATGGRLKPTYGEVENPEASGAIVDQEA